MPPSILWSEMIWVVWIVGHPFRRWMAPPDHHFTLIATLGDHSVGRCSRQGPRSLGTGSLQWSSFLGGGQSCGLTRSLTQEFKFWERQTFFKYKYGAKTARQPIPAIPMYDWARQTGLMATLCDLSAKWDEAELRWIKWSHKAEAIDYNQFGWVLQ